MALTLLQLRTLVRDIVGDQRSGTFSDSQLNEAINYACKAYAARMGTTYIEDTVTPDASGFCTIPTDYIYVKRVYFTVGGTTVTEIVSSTFELEAMKSPTWQTATGVPKRWVQWSGAKVKLTPIPTSIYAAVIGYVEQPTALTSDANTVDSRIPETHNEYLKYCAAAWLYMLDGDTQNVQLADTMMGMFNASIGYAK